MLLASSAPRFGLILHENAKKVNDILTKESINASIANIRLTLRATAFTIVRKNLLKKICKKFFQEDLQEEFSKKICKKN